MFTFDGEFEHDDVNEDDDEEDDEEKDVFAIFWIEPGDDDDGGGGGGGSGAVTDCDGENWLTFIFNIVSVSLRLSIKDSIFDISHFFGCAFGTAKFWYILLSAGCAAVAGENKFCSVIGNEKLNCGWARRLCWKYCFNNSCCGLDDANRLNGGNACCCCCCGCGDSIFARLFGGGVNLLLVCCCSSS